MTGFLRGSSARLAVLVVGTPADLRRRTGRRRLAGVAAGAARPADGARPRDRGADRCPNRVTYSEAEGETTQFGWLLAPGSNGTDAA